MVSTPRGWPWPLWQSRGGQGRYICLLGRREVYGSQGPQVTMLGQRLLTDSEDCPTDGYGRHSRASRLYRHLSGGGGRTAIA